MSGDLGQMLVLPLPLLGIPDTKASAEDLSHGLERHPFAFRIAENDEHPSHETYGGVETKGARRGSPFHDGEEGGSDDDICRPAGHGVLVQILASA